MKITIASDHGAFTLKEQVKEFLISEGHEVKDFGCFSTDSCDYPDFIYPACKEVQAGNAERAIVLCTTGIGVSIVANKVRGIRCGLCSNVEEARLTREHNHANVLAMGAKKVSIDEAKEIINTFLTTAELDGRHQRRVNKIMEIEEIEQ